MVDESRRFPREVDEHFLGDVLRAVAIAADVAQCGGVNQIHVAPDEFGKSGLVAVLNKAAEQFGIFHEMSPDNSRQLSIPPKIREQNGLSILQLAGVGRTAQIWRE